jgi:hypothetical protein
VCVCVRLETTGNMDDKEPEMESETNRKAITARRLAGAALILVGVMMLLGRATFRAHRLAGRSVRAVPRVRVAAHPEARVAASLPDAPERVELPDLPPIPAMPPMPGRPHPRFRFWMGRPGPGMIALILTGAGIYLVAQYLNKRRRGDPVPATGPGADGPPAV